MKFVINTVAHVNRIQQDGVDAAGKKRPLTEAEAILMKWLNHHPWVASFLKELLGESNPFSTQVRQVAFNDVRNELIVTEKQMGVDLRIRFHDAVPAKTVEDATWQSFAEMRTATFFKVTGGILSVLAACHTEAFPEEMDSFFKRIDVKAEFKNVRTRPAGGYLILQPGYGAIEIGL